MPRRLTNVPAARPHRPSLRSRVTGGLTAAAVLGTMLVAAALPAHAVTPSAAGTLDAALATTTTSPKLTWRPPALTSPTTVTVSSTKHNLSLAAGRDYIIKMPTTPLDVRGGLTIAGGRNVVLIGGEIRSTRTSSVANDKRGLYLVNQTGTLHVEGLKITGSTLAEGINLDQRAGGTVQLQNIRVDTVYGSLNGHHADVLQTWGGPATLRVDRLTGYTTYQGFMFQPTQFGSPSPKLFDLRNINIVGRTGSGYLMWRDGKTWPMKITNVWGKPSITGLPRGQWLRPDNTTYGFGYVKVGTPSTGDFVPATRAGTAYVSPGYL
ncbi:hypothetical protein [Cellulomonas aerilata]|uniref:Right handed beta helix domain-containing protein n=1 Tax=Cellulomonas aerilata TaxID=515326 RepID=A0A512DF00_9CELL|nr:hypothetical protein [Cellulomonas aerilata]GEO35064.1 hypothetical protein CAE01nite_27890 [Cellulomonas aerilata]